MFLHGGLMHLGSNLWFLHVFGDNVEETFGRARYLLFYVSCGVAAAGAQVLLDLDSTVPMVGASGAIAGVVGSYLVLYPRAPILSLNLVPLLWFVLGLLVVVPAWIIAGLFFLTNLGSAFLMLGSMESAGVAFFAHLGGFIAGFLVTLGFVDRSRLPRRVSPEWRRARRSSRNPFTRR
jgi:membrane associated rhomboid family serine protease